MESRTTYHGNYAREVEQASPTILQIGIIDICLLLCDSSAEPRTKKKNNDKRRIRGERIHGFELKPTPFPNNHNRTDYNISEKEHMISSEGITEDYDGTASPT